MAYTSVSEIKSANHRAGQYFFEPDTMRFFGSRVGDAVYFGAFFVTSEQREPYCPRLYTLRYAAPSGEIETVGEFQGYPSRAAALRALTAAMSDEVAIYGDAYMNGNDNGVAPRNYVWQAVVGDLAVGSPNTLHAAYKLRKALRELR